MFLKEGAAVLALLLLTVSFTFADHNININTADKDALMTLNGIGEVKAQAIIDYRDTHGPFQSKEDVMNVSGIGPATYDNIKDHITTEEGSSISPSPAPSSRTPTPTPPQSSSSGTSSASAGEFTVDGGADRVVIVGADAQFTARAYSKDKKNVENASFVWNFGDGATAQGASVVHRFEYAGRYAVVVTGSKDGSTATDRFTVTAEEADLSVRVLPDGSIEIENLGERDADLSHWIIQSTGQRFTLPENSLVLAGQTMRISPSVLHFYAGGSSELDYPDGMLAFRAEEGRAEIILTPSPAAPPPPQEQVSQVIQRVLPAKIVSKDVSEDIVESKEVAPAVEAATSSQIAAVGESAAGSWVWWLGAASVSLGAAAAVFVARRAGKKEWNIIEDTSE